MISSFSNPFVQHIAYFLLTLSLIFALKGAIVTYTIGKKTNKKLTVLRISIGTYILGILATILLWITGSVVGKINKNEIESLKNELIISDSLKNIFSVELDSTRTQLDSTSQRLSKLLEEQKPRHLTREQKIKFLEIVRNCPLLPVGVKCVTDDKEAWAYANEFLDLLNQTNFNTHKKIMPIQYFGKPQKGIFLLINNDSEIPTHTLLIQKALEAININAPAQKQKNLEPDYVFILIGHK